MQYRAAATTAPTWSLVLLALCVACGSGGDRDAAPAVEPEASVEDAEEEDGAEILSHLDELPVGLRGLMEPWTGDLDGMIFSYPEPTSVSYNMRDTPMPLDIWWFDEAGVLIGSAGMDPCFSATCTSYRSPGPVMWVLETPSGSQDFAFGSPLSFRE